MQGTSDPVCTPRCAPTVRQFVVRQAAQREILIVMSFDNSRRLIHDSGMVVEGHETVAPVKVDPLYRIQALERAFSVIDVLADSDRAIGLVDLSKRVGLHKSTVHRLIMVLERHGYVERDNVLGTYRLGWKLCELGMRTVAKLDYPIVARPFLEDLVELTGETAHLGVMRSGEVYSLVNVESSRQVRSPATVGRRNAVHCTSLGKAILAFANPQETERFLSTALLKSFTPKTITQPEQFREELQKVQKLGYAMDDEEVEEGLRCVGAPVRDYSGKVIAAISIAGPTSRLTLDRMDVVSGHVIRVAAQLSERLGFHIDAHSAALHSGKNGHDWLASPRDPAPHLDVMRLQKPDALASLLK